MTDLLEKLKELNIKVYITPEGKIKLKGNEEVLTPELIEEARQHKQELIKLLRPVSFLEVEQWLLEGKDIYQEAKVRGFDEWRALSLWYWSNKLPEPYAREVIQTIIYPNSEENERRT